MSKSPNPINISEPRPSWLPCGNCGGFERVAVRIDGQLHTVDCPACTPPAELSPDEQYVVNVAEVLFAIPLSFDEPSTARQAWEAVADFWSNPRHTPQLVTGQIAYEYGQYPEESAARMRRALVLAARITGGGAPAPAAGGLVLIEAANHWNLAVGEGNR